MIFDIEQVISQEAIRNSDNLTELATELKNYFKNIDYGNDVKEIIIGFICVSSDFQAFYKAYKPKYIKYKELKNKYTGQSMVIDRHLGFAIKLTDSEFQKFVSCAEEETKKIVANILLMSLHNFDLLPKSVKDFDKERFKADITNYFKEHCLIE
jgi:hypothetical protein